MSESDQDRSLEGATAETRGVGDRSKPKDPAPPAAADWTGRRLVIRDWLLRTAPSLAELYEGAVVLLDEDSLPGRTRFIAHAVREIRNRLPEVVSGVTVKTRLEYPRRVGELADLWQKVGPSAADLDGLSETDARNVTDSTSIQIDVRLARGIDILIGDHLKTHIRRVESARRLFQALAPENPSVSPWLEPAIRQWLNITEWFVKIVHASKKVDNDFDTSVLKRNFELFEVALASLVGRFYGPVDELDEILEDTNR